MYKKMILVTCVVFCCLSSSLYGLTLKQSITEVLNTNPVVQERLKNFRATQQDLNVAESEYYPKLDFRATYGHTDAGNIKDTENENSWDHAVTNESYQNYEASLTLTQNIFDGFGTMHKVDYEEARILAAAYKFLENANDMAFKMTSSYISIISAEELTKIANESVAINEDIYTKVKDSFDAGLTTDSEVKKIQSALSLARSNLIVQKNNSIETQYAFRRLLGRMPNVSEIEKPEINIKMPESIERAAMYAIKNNPSLLVSNYNIKGAQALWKQRGKSFYPKLDLEMSQFYNDVSNRNSFDSPDDRFRVRFVLTYNFFSGGADKAIDQKQISKISQEVDIKRTLKREVIEGLDLSWASYEMIGKQLVQLNDYNQFSEDTLKLYKEEYDLGKRTLLDLLTAQNDLINSKKELVTAKYAHLLAKYRILDAMGLLVKAVVGDTKDLTSKVNLFSDDEDYEILDTVPIKFDVDNDKISDDIDLCDNSLKENNIMPYGCKKRILDDDDDGIKNSEDQCEFTPIGAKVGKNGCAVDSDKDGIKDYNDKCEGTPSYHQVNLSGCSTSIIITSSDLVSKLSELLLFLKNNEDLTAHIIGHLNDTEVIGSQKAIVLSKQNVQLLKEKLVQSGIAGDRLTIEGRGFAEPLSLDEYNDPKNERFEIELTKIGKEL